MTFRARCCKISLVINMTKLAVIGAGSSGLTAAIAAGRTFEAQNTEYKITLFERQERVGTKITVTGNGRCNLSNKLVNSVFYSGDKEFAETVVSEFDTEKAEIFFKSLGLMTAEEDGRIYPMSFSAYSVLDALRFELLKYNIEVLTDTEITSIEKTENGFRLNNKLDFDRVIMSCGGKSSLKKGVRANGYELLSSLGIEITELYPSLVQIKASPEITKSLKGIRNISRIFVICDGKVIDKSYGEVLFCDYGISGIASMQIGKTIAKNEGKNVKIMIDLCPSMQSEEVKNYISDRIKYNKKLKAEDILSGIMHKRLGNAVMRMSGISPSVPAGEISDVKVNTITDFVKAFVLKAEGTKGFESSQVTAGGANCSSFSPFTMECNSVPGLFVTGELLNVDGDCGGYNLHFAWATGFSAGVAAACEDNE